MCVCCCVRARGLAQGVIVAVARGARGGEEQDGTLPDSRLSDRAAHPLALDQEQAESTDRADALRRGAGGRALLRVRQVPQTDRRLSRDTVRDPSDRGQQILADQGVQPVGRSQVSERQLYTIIYFFNVHQRSLIEIFKVAFIINEETREGAWKCLSTTGRKRRRLNNF